MRRVHASVAAVVLAFVVAESSAAASEQQRRKIGVVLGGGGARGGAHVGVLKFLEELRIPIDFIAGTSIGAIVGGLYATGLSPQEMEDILRHTDWRDALTDDPPRKNIWYRRKEDDPLGYQLRASLRLSNMVLAKGFLAGEKLGIELRWLTLPFSDDALDFDTLPIPYRCVATVLKTGEKRVLRSGDLVRSMRASMAIPAYFTPVAVTTTKSDGKRQTEEMVDGGLVDNLPVDVVRRMGADVVIAVGIRTPPQDVTSIFGVIGRLTSMLTDNEHLIQWKHDDVLIEPDLDTIDAFNFDQFPDSLAPGYEAARSFQQELSAYSVPPDEYEQFLKRQRRPAEMKRPPVVDRWELTPVEHQPTTAASASTEANLRFTKARLSRMHGEVRKEELTRRLEDIYQFNDFSSVDFRIRQMDDRSVLVVEPPATYEAQTRVRLGVLLDTDFSGHSEFSLRGNIRQTELNRRGGEWKTRFEMGASNSVATQLYQPVDAGRRLFALAAGGVRRQPFTFYVDDVALSQYVLGTAQVGLQGGVSFGALGQFTAGIQHDWYKGEETVSRGQSRFPLSTTTHATSLVARVDLDQIDNPNFPRSGWAARAHLMSARGALSGDEPRHTVTAAADWAVSSWRSTQGGCLDASIWMVPECDPNRRGKVGIGNWTLALGVNGMAQVGGRNPPIIESGFLGGFLNLSGLEPHQIWGRYTVIGRMIVHRRMFPLPQVFGTDTHLGASLEAGNAWMDARDIGWNSLRRAGSVFLAADTRLGMVSISYGITDGGHRNLLFVLGLPFSPHRNFDSGVIR